MPNQHKPLQFFDVNGGVEEIYKTHLLPKPVRPQDKNKPKLKEKPENKALARPKK